MHPVRASIRLCALLFAVTALGCSADKEVDDTGTGGSTVAGTATGGSKATGGTKAAGGTATTTGDTSAGGSSAAVGGTGTTTTGTGAGGSGTTVGGTGTAPTSTSAGGSTQTAGGASAATGGSTTVSTGTGVGTGGTAPGAGGTSNAAGGTSAATGGTTAAPTYSIGVAVTGLTGSGLVLQDNAGDDLAVSADGTFAFATKLLSAQTYTVTVKTQPSSPTQACTVSGGSGTITNSNVSSVTVNCSTKSFTIGGTLTGLDGTGLVLQDNAGDDLALSANNSFSFATPVLSGQPFVVTVKTQPTNKSQTCVVTNGTGTVAAGNVTTVGVNCTTNTYAVGGAIAGLAGSGLTLQNNLGDNLVVTAPGTNFAFSTKVASGGSYGVTVLNQPTSPTQVCTVTSGTGSGDVTNADIASVAITCTTSSFTVGGSVVGMTATGLVLQDNGGDDITMDAVGNFVFATPVLSGEKFAVTVKTQPGTEFCSVSGGKGTMGGSNVSSVTVSCSTEAHTVGGTVDGLIATGLELSLNGGTPLPISGNGEFAFPDLIAKGGAYEVTVPQQPSSPSQTCRVDTAASGTVASDNIVNVHVTCVVDSFTIGGQVTGLAGTGLKLQDNSDTAHILSISADGTFAFSQKIVSGQGYAVTVVGQPTSPLQVCTVSTGSGLVTNAAITNVQVTCVTSRFKVGGTISGLAGTVVLSDNTTDTKTLTANGSFTFDQTVASGSTYTVAVQTQPDVPSQTCTVTGGSGSVVDADISNVVVECVTNQFKVGGTVAGLKTGESLSLQNNGGDTIAMSADGTFTFATSITSGNAYAVTISTPPITQNCVVNGGSGNVGDADVSVSVNCTNKPTVGGTVTGLSSSGTVVLALNGSAETLNVTSNGSFAFVKPFNNGDPYVVTVATQPTSPWQTCNVTNGSGTIADVSVADVAIDCTTNKYTLGVNVSGLTGTVVLQNNNADNLTLTADGPAPFATQVASGSSYAVTVLIQPSGQLCTVTSANGTVADVDITLAVTCVASTYSVGGTVVGGNVSGMVLLNNGGDNLSISATGTFTFPTKVASGATYAVTIGASPAGTNCAVFSGTGTVASANVTNVYVSCSPPYNFDFDKQGWYTYQAPAGTTVGWSSTEGSPNPGAIVVPLAFGTVSCPAGMQIGTQVSPVLNLSTFTTIVAQVRVNGVWPTADRSGGFQLFIQDSASNFVSGSFISWWSLSLNTWYSASVAMPTGADLTSIKNFGINITNYYPPPQPSTLTCQDTTIEVDSFGFQ
jgi:large repetitive protein